MMLAIEVSGAGECLDGTQGYGGHVEQLWQVHLQLRVQGLAFRDPTTVGTGKSLCMLLEKYAIITIVPSLGRRGLC